MISFFVHGQPIGQGSTRAFVPKPGAHPIITTTAKGLAAWRRLVADVAQQHAHMHEGAVAIELVFFLPRPKALPKRRPTPHTKRPDLDKAIRAILDALTSVMFRDDAQVNTVFAHKRYAHESGPVGVRITIGPYEDLAGLGLPFKVPMPERHELEVEAS